jgi:alpha-mannosidase
LKYLATKVKGDGDGVLVFNPTGFTRSGIVEIAPRAAGTVISDRNPQAAASGRQIFFASDLPPYGYRRYSTEQMKVNPPASGLRVSEGGRILENSQFKVVLDPTRGVVTSIYDKKADRECIATGGAANRLEIHWEEPVGMSAWTIGKINKVEALDQPIELKVSESGEIRVTVSWDRTFQSTLLKQSVTLAAHGPPEFSVATDWKELGAKGKPIPFLKVAFDVAAESPKFISQIPFGTIARPADNTEVPALKWAALSGPTGGAAILNDCKHGYSAQGSTIRLSLIRSSHDPDPRPNDRPQNARWVFLPITAPLVPSTITAAAEVFNHPLLHVPAAANPSGALPPEMSYVSSTSPNVMLTGLKKAEDDDDLIIRFYEIDGLATGVPPQLRLDAATVKVVDFVEDVRDSDPGVPLRPHEIRTIKLGTGNR